MDNPMISDECLLWEQVFLETGKIPKEAFHWKNQAGEHFLTWAYRRLKWPLLYALIEQGFDVNQQDHDGLTILHDFYLPFETHLFPNPFELQSIAVTGSQTLEWKAFLKHQFENWMVFLREQTSLNPLILNKWGQTAMEWWQDMEKWKFFSRLDSPTTHFEWIENQIVLWKTHGEKHLLENHIPSSLFIKSPTRL